MPCSFWARQACDGSLLLHHKLSVMLPDRRSSDLQAQQQQQAQAQSSQLQQPIQSAQIQQPGPQAPQQLAQPPQNGAIAAAADGGGDAVPPRMLRISDSAAQHEAHHRAKLQEAQVTFVALYMRRIHHQPNLLHSKYRACCLEHVPVLLLQCIPKISHHAMKAVRLCLYWPYWPWLVYMYGLSLKMHLHASCYCLKLLMRVGCCQGVRRKQ